jgi:enoyl-CoA hydratase/carnithine racemase
MTYETISLQVDRGVAQLELARPEAGNAFSWTMADELTDAYQRADADDAIRVVVLSGQGRSFCHGMDVQSIGASTEVVRPQIGGHLRDGGGQVSLAMLGCRKPIIAAVHGAAAGIGVTMTLAADIRIAAESTRFALPFTRRGIVAEACSTWLLPRVVGISQAMEWVATGRKFDAEEALRGRLVSRVVPDDQLLATATGIANDIASNTSPAAVAISRQLLWSALGEDNPWEAHRRESAALEYLAKGPDLIEGAASFMEKRQPTFTAPVATDDFIQSHAWPPPIE